MKYKKPDDFSAGIIFATSVTSLVKDCFGMERYIQYIENHWGSGWYSAPIAIAGIVIAVHGALSK